MNYAVAKLWEKAFFTCQTFFLVLVFFHCCIAFPDILQTHLFLSIFLKGWGPYLKIQYWVLMKEADTSHWYSNKKKMTSRKSLTWVGAVVRPFDTHLWIIMSRPNPRDIFARDHQLLKFYLVLVYWVLKRKYSLCYQSEKMVLIMVARNN